MSRVSGLPDAKKMRHDSHFVDEITSPRSESIGRMIDLRRIEPNPHQPRKEFGDLSENAGHRPCSAWFSSQPFR